MRGVEREDEGALVVLDAASDQEAALTCDLERREVPAEAERHDVHVGDCRDLGVGLAREVRVADAAVAVGGGEPQALRDLERTAQRLCGRGAVGHAGSGVLEVLDGLDGDKVRDVLDGVLPDLIDVGVHLRFELLINHGAFLSRSCYALKCSLSGAMVVRV